MLLNELSKLSTIISKSKDESIRLTFLEQISFPIIDTISFKSTRSSKPLSPMLDKRELRILKKCSLFFFKDCILD